MSTRVKPAGCCEIPNEPVPLTAAEQGRLVAIFKDDYFLVSSSGLAVKFDFTAWGWVHLVVGIVVVVAGLGVMAGQVWARVVGVLLASLSLLANVAFLAAYPFWSLVMIALDIVIIMALTVHGSDIKPE